MSFIKDDDAFREAHIIIRELTNKYRRRYRDVPDSLTVRVAEKLLGRTDESGEMPALTRSYLAKVVQSTYQDYRRHRDAIKRGGGQVSTADAGGAPSPDPGPLDQLEMADELRRLESAIQALSESDAKLADVLVRAFIKEEPIQDIAAHYEKDRSTIRQWLANGYGQLLAAMTRPAPADR